MPCTVLRAFVSLAIIESAAGMLMMLTSPLVLGFNGALQRRVEFPSALKVIYYLCILTTYRCAKLMK